MLNFVKENSKIIKLISNDDVYGAVWFSTSELKWCYSLHNKIDHGMGPLVKGYAENINGACTDLVAAFWKHYDETPMFPK